MDGFANHLNHWISKEENDMFGINSVILIQKFLDIVDKHMCEWK